MKPLSKEGLIAGLISARCESEAIPVHAAYSLVLDVKKYNEMIMSVREQVFKSGCPVEFWDDLPDHLSKQNLNDVEAFVYGMLVMSSLMNLGGSVIWGREAAVTNGLDYDKILKGLIENDMEPGMEN